jgi:hypothetical protein
MTAKFPYVAVVLLPAMTLLLVVLALASPDASAAVPACGQPVSEGPGPSASDGLAILQAAVGGRTCEARPCVCDVNGDSSITATDALRALRRAVGLPVELSCSCDGCDDTAVCMACTSFRFSLRPGSTLDVGWTGADHDIPWYTGDVFSADVLSRCAGSDDACTVAADCGGEPCVPTCDCIDDHTCEITGPTQQRHCLFGLAECEEDDDCHGVGNDCVAMFGPQLPELGGFPQCTMLFFDGDLTGTVDTHTGELEWTAAMKRYVVSGDSFWAPCATCGEGEAQIGDVSTCIGGNAHGSECTVDAKHPYLGDLSYDCARSAPNSSPNPIPLGVVTVTTHDMERVAQLPCSGLFVQAHPTRGNGTCIDDGAACSSNADCLRCRDDVSTTCTTNGDCGQNGPCLAAPEQPVTCGYWCHCGFCGQDVTQPCFDDSQCAPGVSCEAGAGTSLDYNRPQASPNNCSQDGFVCGGEGGTCQQTQVGRCALAPHHFCNQNTDCDFLAAGECVAEGLSCFEPAIARSGSASIGEAGSIDSTAVALACSPASMSGSLNSREGITGPVALSLNFDVVPCFCGDGDIGCGETCDDGNAVSGDGCDERCRVE